MVSRGHNLRLELELCGINYATLGTKLNITLDYRHCTTWVSPAELIATTVSQNGGIPFRLSRNCFSHPTGSSDFNEMILFKELSLK